MYLKRRILGLIPARGGSKGIKGKNLALVAGRPLIAYTIDAALKSRYIDDTVVTTDSKEIAAIAESIGARVPFLRPAEYATDTSKTLDAVLHAIWALENEGNTYDSVVLLQPTQPLRTTADIDGAIERFYEYKGRSLVSVCPVTNHPLLIRSIRPDGALQQLLDKSSTCRRQDMPDYFVVNGCIYINLVKDITESTSFNDNEIPYVMSKDRSLDIDEARDLLIAEFFIRLSKEIDTEL